MGALILSTMRTLYYMLHGEWYCGRNPKPRWGIVRTYYDAEILILHIGPWWIEVDY